jgi:LPS-assembly lipoprotein
MFKKLIILLTTLTLTSCGFHLRGHVPLAPPLHHLYLQSQHPYGELTRNLKQYLRMSGVHLASSPQAASAILTILNEQTSQELISINSSQQTRQYNLRLNVTFQILTPKGTLMVPPQTVTETRPLTLQSNQILAGSNQAAQLDFDMRRAIVYSIMNKLSSQTVTRTLMSKAPR